MYRYDVVLARDQYGNPRTESDGGVCTFELIPSDDGADAMTLTATDTGVGSFSLAVSPTLAEVGLYELDAVVP